MICLKIKFQVSDTSGALVAECFKILRSIKSVAKMGDSVIVTVKKFVSNRQGKFKPVSRGVIIRTKNKYIRSNGMSIRFGDNSIVLIKDNQIDLTEPRGPRITGPTIYELRNKNYLKIMQLSGIIL